MDQGGGRLHLLVHDDVARATTWATHVVGGKEQEGWEHGRMGNLEGFHGVKTSVTKDKKGGCEEN